MPDHKVHTISTSGKTVLITGATSGLGKEVSMEDRNDIHYEDDALDRELNALVREMEQEGIIRRTVIEMLVMLGSDAMLEHDV